ncbi:MAG: DUF1559 domain-containing protein [Verrucomicrobiota bacterium]
MELLASMGLLAILGAITYAGVTSARHSAQRGQCASNLRQIGAAINLYAVDHSGSFPRTTHDYADTESWVNTLAPYLEDVDEIRISPADPLGDLRAQNNGTSYVMNEYIAVINRGDFNTMTMQWEMDEDYTNLFHLENPARTITVFTGADDLSPTIFTDHNHARRWGTGLGGYEAFRQEVQDDRYQDGANYLYADGRVEYYKAEEVKQKFIDGINIAVPPQ